jgi:MFS family permease
LPDKENHPLALRMGVIAGVSHNMVVGAIFGSFGVMLASVEQRMGVSAQMSALGIPAVIIASSLISPVVGSLAARFSLRLLMLAGALATLAAFLLLAFTNSFTVYILCYLALFGPAMALGGSVGPTTLITRWFNRHRGLALGLAHLSIVVAILPVLCNWVYEHHGAQATYLMLAGLVAVILVPFALMIRDFPPDSDNAGLEAKLAAPGTDGGGLTAAQIVARPQFWAIALCNAAIITGAMSLGAILIPMAVSWGNTRGDAALLASIMSFAGMAGSVFFGWVADRIGGARGLALVAINCAVLWSLLLFNPAYPALAVIIGLIGMHGAGAIPNVSRAIGDAYGRDGFSRAFGLSTLVSLPFAIAMVVGSSAVFTKTGSYAPAITGMVIFLALVAPLGYWARRRTERELTSA